LAPGLTQAISRPLTKLVTPVASNAASKAVAEALSTLSGTLGNPYSVGNLADGAMIASSYNNLTVSTKAVNSLARSAAKVGTDGGLNLFKFGSKEATSSAGWKSGDRFLKMFDKGTPKLNWRQNSGFLRSEMKLGKPIYDSYRLTNGNLIPTRGFLNAERSLLQNRGWLYNPGQGAWLPPF
jgi:hypothetical protein